MAIITIDGPAGAGKSEAAKGLAKRLGFDHLDTGAMYRCVALVAIRRQLELSEAVLGHFLKTLRIDLRPNGVFLDDEDVTQAIRESEVSSGASKVAALDVVREYLVAEQRRIADGRNFVCEGRDQGTVVFPEAACKFFLTASENVRAERRLKQLHQQGKSITLEELLEDQRQRDARDSQRKTGPLRKAKDAIEIDSSDQSLEQILDRLEREVRRCLPG
jgi:CMP/dCMP kinase